MFEFPENLDFEISFGAKENLLNELEWKSCLKLLDIELAQSLMSKDDVIEYLIKRFYIQDQYFIDYLKQSEYWVKEFQKYFYFQNENLLVCQIDPYSQMIANLTKQYQLLLILPLENLQFGLLFSYQNYWYVRIISVDYCFVTKINAKPKSKKILIPNNEIFTNDSVNIIKEYYIQNIGLPFQISEKYIVLNQKNYIWWKGNILIEANNNKINTSHKTNLNSNHYKYEIKMDWKDNLFIINDKKNIKKDYHPFLWILNIQTVNYFECDLPWISIKIPNSNSFLFLQWNIDFEM